jgi:hypothetical protein
VCVCVYVFVIPGMVGDKLLHRNRIAAVGIHAPINFLAAAHQRQYLYFCTSKASKLEASVRIDAPENFKDSPPEKYDCEDASAVFVVLYY